MRRSSFGGREGGALWRWGALGWLAAAAVGAALATAAGADDLPAAATALTSPPVLQNLSTAPHKVEVELTAAPANVSLIPGKVTRVYAYNGSVPGPTLELHEGDQVTVHFHNNLPEATTVHWHGLHIPVKADGNPMDLVPPGGSYDYVFPILPGMAGTYWYHPHPHQHVARQVARGLFGAIIVRAADDPISATIPEKLLILMDRQINANGSLVIPGGGEVNGTEGNVRFVNGQILPSIPIRSGEVQRWRIINASPARFYRLSLPGHTLLQVGTDGGLFEHPVERSEILLTPAERAEVLIRGTGAPGSHSVLQDLPYDRYIKGYRPPDWEKTLDLLSLDYTADSPVTPPVIPTTLRAVTPIDPATAVRTRTIVLRDALIGGKFFNMNRTDVSVPLNTTEIWLIDNQDEMDHPFHMHGFSFQVLDRNGVPEPFLTWKDTVDVPKGQKVRIIVRFADYPGMRMFHCHILDHEDYGMMAMLEVLPP
jgi:FtsP/CotA-like multicopper oxidase with cupredoxin domain